MSSARWCAVFPPRAFLRKIETSVSQNQAIRLVAESYITHTYAQACWQPRLIPTDGSRLNQFGRFFALIAEKTIRRGSFSRMKDLADKVDHFAAKYNKDCTPFEWTATADANPGKLERLSSRISGTAHDQLATETPESLGLSPACYGGREKAKTHGALAATV
jgi:putative transposase